MFTDIDKKILMIFIEPTPYILDLLEKGFEDNKKKLSVFFLDENITQSWNAESSSVFFQVLKTKKQIFQLIGDIFFKRKYQMIHLAGWNKFLSIFLILTSRLIKIPVVVETDTPLNPNIIWWKKISKKIIYPLLFKFPVFFLPGGIRQKKYLNYYGVRDNKIKNAQMTVDIEKIQHCLSKISASDRERKRAQHYCQQDDTIFLFVGRLLDWKGVRELLIAFQSFDNPRAKLWIVGDGELADEVRLAEKANKRITYFGRINHDVLWHIYHAADVFVLASYWEPWGLVINEAMAAGKPLIVTETVGCLEDLIFNAKTGLIIQPKSIDELRNAMDIILKNVEKRMQMAKNALSRISSWTLQNEAKNIMLAWKKFL